MPTGTSPRPDDNHHPHFQESYCDEALFSIIMPHVDFFSQNPGKYGLRISKIEASFVKRQGSLSRIKRY
jgi:hypothetical protein